MATDELNSISTRFSILQIIFKIMYFSKMQAYLEVKLY